MGIIRSYGRLSELFNEEAVGQRLIQEDDFTVHRLEVVHAKPAKSPTFRANYYSFVLIEKGRSSYSIDGRTFTTKDRTLYFTNPGHLKSFDIPSKVYGFLITVSEGFLKQHIHQDVFESFSFLLTEIVPPCYLKPGPFSELLQLAEQIRSEQQKESVLKNRIMSSLFMVFLLKVKEFLLKNRDFKEEFDRDSEIVRNFKRDLERRFRTNQSTSGIPQVREFAERQQLSPGYFSTVVKTKTGKTANRWIQDKLISEAQSMLANSRMSVKEIAYSLGFQEATHFSKYFKKLSGLSPMNFRKEQGKRAI